MYNERGGFCNEESWDSKPVDTPASVGLLYFFLRIVFLEMVLGQQ